MDQTWKRCWCKIPYNKKMAIKAVKISSKKYGIKFRYYKCEYCEKWHLTKSKKRRMRNGQVE